MRKVILGVVMLGAVFSFSSCNKLKEAKEAIEQAAESAKPIDVDYRMFENKEATKKVFDDIVAKLGEQAKVVDEIDISISRPSVEGTIKRAGEADRLSITIDTQDPTNLKRIRRTNYWSTSGGWQPSEQMEVNVITGNKENFKLEDSLFDFNQVTFDVLFKVITDAYAKYKDTEKYEYQYISRVEFDKGGIEVKIYGKLASNEQEKSNYYKADFKGNPRR
ncbi:hypothetical protein M2132_001840 [Dysgonomonas sp. PH5-45]|uniref:hypothetical protein n=1 Tax=unclassified Dysgonomonas TaxID=2630389 RepID=UPI002473F69E|nr:MULTISPECIES: hypothetical protein [unclassified Dysgonomonas]MDH6355497.1 hypothetical protein [Dysgonomonas sp. PH5-45]MDH6388393.1 hypothetical protein [Dysgonomonas sp. PH5-37]